jgi:hypothetical protein
MKKASSGMGGFQQILERKEAELEQADTGRTLLQNRQSIRIEKSAEALEETGLSGAEVL